MVFAVVWSVCIYVMETERSGYILNTIDVFTMGVRHQECDGLWHTYLVSYLETYPEPREGMLVHFRRTFHLKISMEECLCHRIVPNFRRMSCFCCMSCCFDLPSSIPCLCSLQDSCTESACVADPPRSAEHSPAGYQHGYQQGEDSQLIFGFTCHHVPCMSCSVRLLGLRVGRGKQNSIYGSTFPQVQLGLGVGARYNIWWKRRYVEEVSSSPSIFIFVTGHPPGSFVLLK